MSPGKALPEHASSIWGLLSHMVRILVLPLEFLLGSAKVPLLKKLVLLKTECQRLYKSDIFGKSIEQHTHVLISPMVKSSKATPSCATCSSTGNSL